MKELTKILRITISTLLLFFTVFSCVDSGITNPNDVIEIKILSPVSNDTVQVGKNWISYELKNPARKNLDHFEVVINDGDFVEIFEATGKGNETELYLTIDSTLLFTRISYFINVATTENKYSTSAVQENIYVQENTDPPQKPLNLRLTKLTGNETTFSVSLEWDDSSNNETQYELWRKVGADGEYGSEPYRVFPANTHRTNDDGLSRFVTYYYKVSAINKYGRSEFSNEVSTADTPDEAPMNLKAVALGATKVKLTWDDNSIPKLGYRIQRSDFSSTDYQQIAIVATKEYIDEGLSPSTTYSYRVQSFTSLTESEWSSPVNVTTRSQDIPPPGNLTAVFDSTTKNVEITWDDDTFQENGTFIERKKGAGGNYVEIGSTAADINYYTDVAPEPGYTYFYRARHFTTDEFYTEYSNEATVEVPNLPPAAPTNMKVTPTENPNEYLITWDDNATDEDGYELWRKDGDNPNWTQINYPADYHAVLFQAPAGSNIVYYFKVRAYRGQYYSDFSNEAGTDGSTGSDNIILTLSSRLDSPPRITIAWSNITEPRVGFSIERKVSWQQDDAYKVIKQTGPTTFSYTDDNNDPQDPDILYNWETYNYRVRAIYSTGYSEYSNVLYVPPNGK